MTGSSAVTSPPAGTWQTISSPEWEWTYGSRLDTTTTWASPSRSWTSARRSWAVEVTGEASFTDGRRSMHFSRLAACPDAASGPHRSTVIIAPERWPDEDPRDHEPADVGRPAQPAHRQGRDRRRDRRLGRVRALRPRDGRRRRDRALPRAPDRPGPDEHRRA